MSTRLLPKHRKTEILATALGLAERFGYTNVSREQIAAKANVSPALVSHYFGTMTALRRTIMRHAVAEGNAIIIAQGLVDKNPYARKAPTHLQEKAIATLTA